MANPLFSRDALSYEAGDVVADRYRVTGVVGRGGFGAVYAAEHTGTHQAVALKMLTAGGEDDSEASARFYREARITAGLSAPNTVRVFDVGRAQNGPLFIAMELLKGPTLEQVLKKLEAVGRIMSEQQAVRIAVSILNSLAEAHAAGLVHRDLKPANVMLAHVTGGEPVVKVLDFGCSSTIDSNLTVEGTVLGTPGYMSPEQCRGEHVDGRSDLYALGVILYRCTTGRLPFEGEQPLTLIYKHASEPVPDPREVSTHAVSDLMATVLLQSLEKKPDARFRDAQKMRRVLEDALSKLSADAHSAGDGHTQIQGARSSRNPLANLLTLTFDPGQFGESKGEQDAGGLNAATEGELELVAGLAAAGQTLPYGERPAAPQQAPQMTTAPAQPATADDAAAQAAQLAINQELPTQIGRAPSAVDVYPAPPAAQSCVRAAHP